MVRDHSRCGRRRSSNRRLNHSSCAQSVFREKQATRGESRKRYYETRLDLFQQRRQHAMNSVWSNKAVAEERRLQSCVVGQSRESRKEDKEFLRDGYGQGRREHVTTV
jgi:hypothetical protein